MAIDFAALAARLLQQSRSLLAEWYPEGKLAGYEFKIGDVFGGDGDSCSINVNTGQWKDFATGEKGGDLISLYAAREGLSQGDAAKKLAGDSTIVSRISTTPPAQQTEPEAWIAIMPVPGDAGAPSNEYWRKGPKNAAGEQEWLKLRYIARWAYLDSEGRTLGYAVRFEWHEGEKLCKDIVPQTYCTNSKREKRWRWKSFPGKRPLYGLDQLYARPDAPVMVVEGEKKVEALKNIAPQYVGIAWPGGAAAWQKADWTPIKGRIVTCWPDADKQIIRTERQAQAFKRAIGELIPADHQPGIKAMWEIGYHLLKLCPTVKVIIPDDPTLPDGWDCADAVAGGWDWQRLKKWASSRVFTLTEGGSNELQQRSTGRRTDERAAVRQPEPDRATAREVGRSDHAQRVDRVPLERSRDAADQAKPVSELPGDAAAADGAALARDQRADEDHSARARTAERATPGLRRGDEQSGAERERDEPRERQGADGAIPPRSGVEPAAQVQRPGDLRAAADRAQAGQGERSAPTSQVGRWLSWNLERNGNGLPLTNLNNAVRVLEADPALRGLVWFDEFLTRLITGDPSREWSDVDDINLVLYMQREIGLSKMGIDSVRQAVVAMAKRHARNCVKEYIEATTWDSTPRIDGFMHAVFHCEDTDYTRAASRNFWVSMLARVYQPGCKVDNMIVLEGAQGLMKSSALNAIADPWFAEQHEAATNHKAFAEVLQAKLLTEISEMDSFDRAEVKAVKGVVSNKTDRYRASYERHAADHPRQGIMAGTTNKDDWNRDETGARRFWPIRCNGMADIAYVRAWRAQCFAEALVALRGGASWWEMPAASTSIEQRKRYDADPWITPISEYLVGRDETTVNEIAGACLKIEIKDLDRVRQMRVAGVLRALGWTNDGNGRRGGKVVKVWRSPGDAFGAVATSENVATSDPQLAGAHKSQSVLTFDGVATSEPSGQVATERSLPEDDIPFQ